MARLTLTEYAAHRGCYPRAVEAAIAAGRIRRDPDGLIDAEKADADWAASTNPVRSAASKANGQHGQSIRKALGNSPSRSATRPQSSGAPENPPTDISAYAKSRADRERYTAELQKLTLLERQGKLVDRATVEAEAEQMGRQLHEAFLALPDRLADEFAAETDAIVIRRQLEEEIRGVLARLAGPDAVRRACGG